MIRNLFEPWHLVLVVAILVLLFGSKKLPDMARGLGKSMRVLKAETKALKNDTADGYKSGSADADGKAEAAADPASAAKPAADPQTEPAPTRASAQS